MIKYTFKSNFSSDILGMIELKLAIGFTYLDSQRVLYNFDCFCCENFPEEKVLSKEICMTWSIRKKTESNNGFRNRMSPIRELAKHLIRQDKVAYIIPSDLTPKSARFIPHIYSLEELSVLFSALDAIKPKKNYPVRHLVIPVFFRLLYCCGIRPIEARKLRVEDVNLNLGYFTILESKNHKSRKIYPSDDLIVLLKKYDKKVEELMPNRCYFFPNSQDEIYTKKWMEKTFKVQWKKAGLLEKVGKAPRIYDLRHTFATHRLYLWLEEGKDINAFFPYLSDYMGHEQFSDTAYYIHLIPGLFQKMSNFDISKRQNLLLEVKNDELP